MLDDFKTQRAVEVVVGEGVVSAYVFIGPDGFVLFRLDVGRVEAPETSECFSLFSPFTRQVGTTPTIDLHIFEELRSLPDCSCF